MAETELKLKSAWCRNLNKPPHGVELVGPCTAPRSSQADPLHLKPPGPRSSPPWVLGMGKCLLARKIPGETKPPRFIGKVLDYVSLGHTRAHAVPWEGRRPGPAPGASPSASHHWLSCPPGLAPSSLISQHLGTGSLSRDKHLLHPHLQERPRSEVINLLVFDHLEGPPGQAGHGQAWLPP